MAEVRWSIIAVGLIIAATMFSFTFRYELLPQQDSPLEATMVWDRWNARTCLIGIATSHKMLCTLDELDKFAQRKD